MRMRLIDANALMEYCNNLKDKTVDANDIARFPTAVGWISVKDRLPEKHKSIFYKLLGTPKWSNSMWKQESEKVLVYVSFPDGTGVVTTGCLHNSDWITTVSKALPQTVTHWMPLPEPPRKEEHNGEAAETAGQ